MANTHHLFLEFNGNLSINSSKKKQLMKSKDALRERITAYFKEHHPGYVPEFFIQGSYKMKTMIRTKEDTCDLDDGIHFKCEPDVSPTTLQKWVYNAVEGHTDGGQEHRQKCIRVKYKGLYHIDLPVYKQGEDDDFPFLAIKGGQWDDEESDPKGFVDWYDEHKSEQMVRLTKYLKAWGDQKRKKMPSGLAMTLFAEKYIQPNERDDIALKDTLIKMRHALFFNWSAIMPTKPNDDIIAKHDQNFRDHFFEALDAFIEDAKKAIEEPSEVKASKLWQKHLGSYFPDGKDIDESDKESIRKISERGTVKPYFDTKK